MSHGDGSASIAAPVLLLLATLGGLALANSPVADIYAAILAAPVAWAPFGWQVLDKNVLLLVNDGLMAVFFLFVGLELKREALVGEMSGDGKAWLPLAGALGGMLIPATLFWVMNPDVPENRGWGIPMATDIAFALGILAVLGSRVPAALKVLLTAIAIADDLGAILIIAVFYTEQVQVAWLLAAAGLFAAGLIMNRLGILRVLPYLVLGIPLWYAFLKSGVHATIAGVVLAMLVPLAPKAVNRAKFLEAILTGVASDADSPAVWLEKRLYRIVAFAIVPAFALANAGVGLAGITFGSVSWGIVAGLVLGKPLGILGGIWACRKLTGSPLSSGVTMRDILGIGALAGIGFTMSLFIASLAFSDVVLLNEAKSAILLASTISACLGVAILMTRTTSGRRAD